MVIVVIFILAVVGAFGLLAWRLRREEMEPGGSDGKQMFDE